MTDQETHKTELEVVRRRRAAAAFILITASLSVGILVGRLSATLVPSDPPQSTASAASAGRTSQPTKPVVAAAEPAPAAQPAPQPAKPVDTSQPPKLEITKDLSAAASVPAPTTQVAVAAVGDSEPAASSDAQSNDDKVTVINPRRSEAAPPPSRETAPPSSRPRIASERASIDSQKAVADASRNDARVSGFEECERRYSSFRREDGTYQPYGSGTRIRCPHLR